MINMILFGVGIALLCGIGLLFASNAERHARERREASRKLHEQRAKPKSMD